MLLSGEGASWRVLSPEEIEEAGPRFGGRAGEMAFVECQFAGGVRDQIGLGPPFEGAAGASSSGFQILRTIWPVLRGDCLEEALSPKASAAAEALLWTVATKSDAAILVLDSAGQVLKVNASGREVLDSKTVLIEAPDGLICANPAETKAFRQALKACVLEGAERSRTTELIVFLEGRDANYRRPISLSRFDDPAHGVPLIVAILPRQPQHERIEMLAQKLGLSPVEARVAALIRLGLSNRDAAHIAGLKEQTFNTYAKRALAKLNVTCRAEMAQLLTWQASLGREL